MPVRAKICGITRPEDAEHAVQAGAWALGCILWPGSPRRCSLEAAAAIVRAHRRQAEVVAVVVDMPLDELARIVDAVRFTAVQLHGEEGPMYADELARRTGARIFKAARVRTGADVQAIEAFRRVDLHLLDAHHPSAPGGTGATWDWSLVTRHRSSVPVGIAGGLTPENVGEAIAATRPWAVDVAGGTEAAPGIKDPQKVEAFLEAVRTASPVEVSA